MKANRNRDAASPRFLRGLALVALTGALGLLVCRGLRGRAESDFVAPASELATVGARSSETSQKHSAPRVFHVSTSPAERWGSAFAAIEAESDPSARGEQWSSLLAGIRPDDISAVLDELQSAGLGTNEFAQCLLRRWAATDARAAAAWAEQLPVSTTRDRALSGVAIEWANADLKLAAEWAQQLPDAAARQTAMLTVANEAVRTEPMTALRLAVDLPPNGERDEAIRRAASEWALQDAFDAVEWAKKIPDRALRNATLAAEIISWSETAPETAATSAIELLPPGRLLEDTVVSIAQRWAQQEPELAAAWVAQFPSGNLKLAALENVAAMRDFRERQSTE